MSVKVFSSSVKTDKITDEISRIFDYKFNGSSSFEVPSMPAIPDNYRIGLIVGPSGSGKSSILRGFGEQANIKWDNEKAVASHFASAEEAAERLSAVGFNSIPAWLRPYSVLSTGEKFRADIARSLGDNAIIDEFTSVVDRDVAKACSYAVSRYARKNNVSGMVFATCHYDVIDWLMPDWVFDTATRRLVSGRFERRPEISLELLPCTAEAWVLFREHHYLDGNINKGARCWLAVWGGKVVGFASAIAFPNGNFKNAWRGHRTVVLPDFQGLGIGVRISDAVAKIFVQDGCRYFSKTAHPRMGAYRDASPLWRKTSKNGLSRGDYASSRATKEAKHKHKHAGRVCWSHEYVEGPDG